MTVLLVDDDEDIRNLTRRILEMQGYEVLVAAHGAEGLELFKRHRDRIGLVISDIVMPVMSGTELARAVNRDAPDLPILLVSGYAQEFVSEGMKGVRASFLAKPYTFRVLTQTIQQILNSRVRK